jgi:hypothetical protein
MNFPKFWAQGRSGAFTSWRWSNTSLEEAQSTATQNAQRLAALFDADPDRRLDRYAYADRPLREPVLQEIRNAAGDLSAVVTRNSYGCHVLNAARALFVDVDLPEAAKGGALVGEKLRAGIGALFGHKAQPPEDPVQAIIAKAEDWAKRQSGWNWRIYRTSAGLRFLATHALFDPKDPVCQAVFDATGADPLYRKLCQTQECFRARLTPKPWRCDIGNPPNRWPFLDHAAELAFNSWDGSYQSASRLKASCNLLSEGTGQIHDELRPLVKLHDDMTRATSSLPLA